MQRPGFNIECNDNNYARWGYCANCQDQRCQLNDADDSDAAIGIGLKGSCHGIGCPEQMGAGWTQLFANGPKKCKTGKPYQFKRVWISVRKTTEPHGKDTTLFYI